MGNTTTSDNHITYVLQHRISWWLGDVETLKAPTEMPESAEEHIERMIKEGYNQGELCVLAEDGDTEFRGWWSIER